ncbi:transcription elongation factor GreA [Alteromonadaceae bacterium Bs31]|nr:transcription elongation factor GreA [Alteromonadaceae bacterium Bs31]
MIIGQSRYENWITARWRDCLIQASEAIKQEQRDQLATRIAMATVVETDEIMESRVQFGSRVTVFGIEEEEEQSFQIVSRDESVSGHGLLDQGSPLAQALFGAREGDVVRVLLANGSNSDYEVTHIRKPY